MSAARRALQNPRNGELARPLREEGSRRGQGLSRRMWAAELINPPRRRESYAVYEGRGVSDVSKWFEAGKSCETKRLYEPKTGSSFRATLKHNGGAPLPLTKTSELAGDGRTGAGI